MHLEKFTLVPGVPHMRQITCQEDLDTLVRVADARMHHPQVSPTASLVAGLLTQFAPCTRFDGLPGINLARRQFEKRPPQWITELSLENQPAIVKARHDHDCARVSYVFPVPERSIRQEHTIAPDFQQSTVEDRFSVDLCLVQGIID